MNFKRIKKPVPWLCLALACLFIVSVSIGRACVNPSDIFRFIYHLYTGDSAGPTPGELVFWWIRVPRCVMAILVGSSLAVSGAVYQALFRNPLVSPDILGVSAGCTFGAALALVLPFDSFSLVNIMSLSFGLIAVTMSVGLARVIAVKPVIVLVLQAWWCCLFSMQCSWC